MIPAQTPYSPQSAIDKLRYTASFKEWNRQFENLRRAISRRISPRDIQPILKAGAEEGALLTKLAFVVDNSDYSLREVTANRRRLSSLVAQIVTVSNHATRLVNDPRCDGRFWMAVEGLLSWDWVSKPDVVEASVIKRMGSVAELFQARADALGQLSPQLRKATRNRGMRELLGYVWLRTRNSGKNFDSEITYLLSAAYKAVGREKHFTVDQIKKFRQRHLSELRKLDEFGATRGSRTDGRTMPVPNEEPIFRRKSLGQRIADISFSSK